MGSAEAWHKEIGYVIYAGKSEDDGKAISGLRLRQFLDEHSAQTYRVLLLDMFAHLYSISRAGSASYGDYEITLI